MKKQYLPDSATCKVTFHLPPQAVGNASSVVLLGDFNDWDWRQGISLDKQADGSFLKELDLLVGQNYQFRYVIDQATWENDWAADGYVKSPYNGIDNGLIFLADAPQAQEAIVDAKTKKEKKAAVAEPVAAAPKKKAAKKAEITAAVVDKLTKIEGIGPKIEGLLYAAGISTYAQLAETSAEHIREILLSAGSRYKMFDPTTWPQQARLAADGNWDELQTLQDELNGGKI